MNIENNIVLKQECHSPRSLWGIFRIRNVRGIKEAKGYEEDPRQQPSGMTTYLNNNPSPALRAPSPARGEENERCALVDRPSSPRSVGMRGIGAAQHLYPALQAGGTTKCVARKGFTLIELLVVVLIIGILAAIALPQYQKAVEKSKAAQSITLVKAIGATADFYYQEHGRCPNKLTDLDVQFPAGWNKKTLAFQDNAEIDSQANDDWSLEITHGVYKNICAVVLTRLTGTYRGAVWDYPIVDPSMNRGELHCVEIKDRSAYAFKQKNGAYCEKLFGGSLIGGENVRIYKLPSK